MVRRSVWRQCAGFTTAFSGTADPAAHEQRVGCRRNDRLMMMRAVPLPVAIA